MNYPKPEGWKQISPEDFKVLLGMCDWTRDAWADAQTYFHRGSKKQFAWESADGKTVLVEPGEFRAENKPIVKCCDIPIQPKWRIRFGHDGQPRYVSICPECSKETPGEVNEEAKKLLRYALVNDLLAVDPAVDNVERIETKEEPEMVKALTQLMKGEDDNAVAMRIWFNFRYAFKKANQLGQAMNWVDIEALIEAAMKRTRKEIASEENKKMILGRFEVMLNRVREFMVNPDAKDERCKTCGLPLFICACPREMYNAPAD